MLINYEEIKDGRGGLEKYIKIDRDKEMYFKKMPNKK